MKEPQTNEQETKPKIGASHAAAMGRVGLKELSSILPAFPESVQPIEEYGLYGTVLPSDVAKSRDDPNQQKQYQPNLNVEMEM